MKYRPVKTAVIGCGMISDTYLANLSERFYIIDLVGCADMVEKKAAAQAEKYKIRHMTVDEILSDPEIELVLNLTYPTSHVEVSRKILSSKKHCYSEKMMSVKLSDAAELKRIADKNGVMLCAAPDTFLGASQQTARYLIDRGIIGEPVSVLISLTRGYHLIKTDEEDAQRKFSVMYEGGGIPYDMGGYYLHQLFNMFGPVDMVCGFSYTRKKDRPYLNPRNSHFNDNFSVNTSNTVSAAFMMDCGISGTFQLSSEYSTTQSLFLVSGTEGQLELGDPNNFGDPIYITKNGSERMPFPLSHPYAESCRGIGAADMAWALRCGRKSRMSFEMGYHALEFISAINDCTEDCTVKRLVTKFERPKPISSEYYGGTAMERSLFI